MIVWIIFLIGAVSAQQEYICGTTKLPQGSRVVGGSDSTPGLMPWTLKLEQSQDGGNTFDLVCSAALIDPEYAVTAARCIDGVPMSELRVVAGAAGGDLAGMEQYIDIMHMEIHPNYSTALVNETLTYYNDIALIHFMRQANLSDPNPVNPICLPPTSDTEYFENPSAVASGYGTVDSNGTYPETLQHYWIDVIRELQCELWWPEGFIQTTQVCAYDQIERAFSLCEGDAGSPLSCMIDGRFDLAGIGSMYRDGCKTRFPSIYTSVPLYLDWIVEVTGVQPRPE